MLLLSWSCSLSHLMLYFLSALGYNKISCYFRLLKDFPDNEEAFSVFARRPFDEAKAKASNGVEVSGMKTLSLL